MPDEIHAVAHGQQHVLHARVVPDALVDGTDRARVLVVVVRIRHASRPERVVEDHQACRRQLRQRRLVVVDVVRLVGIDEDEIELALELADRVECRPEPVLDAVGDLRFLRVAACDLRRLVVDVAGDHAAVRGECERHRDRRVAGERAELEDPLGAGRADERTEELSLEEADHHLRTLGFLARLGGEALEELAVRRRMRLGVLLDSGLDDEAHSTRPNRTQPL